jgi:hypothetical protein
LVIERTESCSPVREIQSGPCSRAGAVGWFWRSVSHGRSAARAERLSGTTRRAVALAVADDELAGALGQAYVAGVEVGEFADPQSGTQQQLHDRPIAARAEAIGLALHRPQLLGRERPRRRRVDLDARHARCGQRARVQQRRRGSERQVDRRGREGAVDEAPAPVAQEGAACSPSRARNMRSSSPASRWATSSLTQRR